MADLVPGIPAKADAEVGAKLAAAEADLAKASAAAMASIESVAAEAAADIVKRNEILAEKYNKNGSFPLVVLLDKTGKVLGMSGFKNISAPEYIELLHSFEK